MRNIVSGLQKCILLCLLVSLYVGWNARERAVKYGATAEIVLTIVNDEQRVVSNADVEVYFELSEREGKTVKGKSDHNGKFVVDGKTTGEIYISADKNGFYKSMKKLDLYEDEHREVRSGHWMPEEIVTNVVLKRIINPISILKANDTIPIPTTNTWLGFDMVLKDFTPPYGKGQEIDFEVLFQWDGKPQPYSEFYSLNIRFTSKGSGVYRSVRSEESMFPWVYNANENGYEPLQIHLFRRRINRNFEKEIFDRDHPLICRSRCRYDENGNIISANYSLIVDFACSASWQDKGLFRFSYLFNPTANDRNLEEKNIYNTPNFGQIGGFKD